MMRKCVIFEQRPIDCLTLGDIYRPRGTFFDFRFSILCELLHFSKCSEIAWRYRVRLRDMLTPILTDPFVEFLCVFYFQFFTTYRVICVLPVFFFAVEYRHQLVDKGNDVVHCCLFRGKSEEVLNGRFVDDRWKEVGNTKGWPQKVSIICAAVIFFIFESIMLVFIFFFWNSGGDDLWCWRVSFWFR